MDCFVIAVMVLHDFCTRKVKTPMKTQIFFPVPLVIVVIWTQVIPEHVYFLTTNFNWRTTKREELPDGHVIVFPASAENNIH